MKAIVPVALLVCALSACGGSESPADATSGEAQAETKQDTKSAATTKPDPETPADQFVDMQTSYDCLGLYANLAPPDGMERAVVQFADMEDPGFRDLQGFDRADKIKAAQVAFDASVAPMKGKTLFTYTSKTNDDYREYNMEQSAFFDSTQLTWGGRDPMGNSTGNHELSLSKNNSACVLRLVNTEAWNGQFMVKDEQQARAADAARQAGNGHVKYYLQAVSADAANNSLDWPRVNAEIVRVELVDKAGNLLARAQPSL